MKSDSDIFNAEYPIDKDKPGTNTGGELGRAPLIIMINDSCDNRVCPS